MKTLIGFVTFGNLDFTKLCVRGIRETTTRPYDLLAVIGMHDDTATQEWFSGQQINFLLHSHNRGFPASVNDLYDVAFTRGDYDHLVILGNDVVPFPGAIDAMIDLAAEGKWDWICASEFNSASLVARYPDARPFFHGQALMFTDFTARPWELHIPVRRAELAAGDDVIERDCIKDVRNLTLFTRHSFQQIGYDDVNFWPGGYFADNDYCRRGRLAGVKACGLPRAGFFHFWSRTIHQGGGMAANNRHFGLNRQFYIEKWGGAVDEEAWTIPFNGTPHLLPPDGPVLKPELGVFTRDQEAAIIRHWRDLPG